MSVRKFSDPIEELRKIAATKSHGEAANLHENDVGNLVYRARYEKAIDRVERLVLATGGEVIQRGRGSKIKRDAKGRTTSNAQPFYIEFSVGIDEDVFIRTGARLENPSQRAVAERLAHGEYR